MRSAFEAHTWGMSSEKNAPGARRNIGDIAPKLAEITHLAFYVGWPNAMSSIATAKELFAGKRG